MTCPVAPPVDVGAGCFVEPDSRPRGVRLQAARLRKTDHIAGLGRRVQAVLKQRKFEDKTSAVDGQAEDELAGQKTASQPRPGAEGLKFL